MGLHRWLSCGKTVIRNRISSTSSSRDFSHNSILKNKLCVCSQRKVHMPTIMKRPSIPTFMKMPLMEYCTNSNDINDKQFSRIPNDLQAVVREKHSLTTGEWEELIKKLIHSNRRINIRNSDYVVIESCFLSRNHCLATSYIDYLSSQGRELNLASLGLYLKFCGSVVNECGEEKVLQVYQQILQRTKIFDSSLSSLIIVGLTSTREWREALKYIPIVRKSGGISWMMYNAIITAAFRNGDDDTGWQYLDAMYQEEKVPGMDILKAWIDRCEKAETTDEKKVMMSTLFHKMDTYRLFPDIEITSRIATFCEKNFGWSHSYVEISQSGVCKGCKRQLCHLKVDEKGFKQLQKEFVPCVLEGSDIFRSTTPREWNAFRSFVSSQGPFSAIIDGLNVYHGGQNHRRGVQMILEAVKKLQQFGYGRNILVIGRIHMTRWSPQHYQQIKRSATVYTLENLTKDDGFFIYAALHSGLGTLIVTNDRMRNHAHKLKLKELSLKETFQVWQQSHQIIFDISPKGLQFSHPLRYAVSAQNIGTERWHIPYDDGKQRFSYELPKTWLCLQNGDAAKETR